MISNYDLYEMFGMVGIIIIGVLAILLIWHAILMFFLPFNVKDILYQLQETNKKLDQLIQNNESFRTNELDPNDSDNDNQ